MAMLTTRQVAARILDLATDREWLTHTHEEQIDLIAIMIAEAYIEIWKLKRPRKVK